MFQTNKKKTWSKELQAPFFERQDSVSDEAGDAEIPDIQTNQFMTHLRRPVPPLFCSKLADGDRCPVWHAGASQRQQINNPAGEQAKTDQWKILVTRLWGN